MSLLDEPMPRDIDLERDAIAAEDANAEIPAEMTEAEARALVKAYGLTFDSVIETIAEYAKSEEDRLILAALRMTRDFVGQVAWSAVDAIRTFPTNTPAIRHLLMAATYQASAGASRISPPTPWALARLRDALDALSDRNPLLDPR